MIKKSGNGYVVKSEGGKNLSKRGISKDAAEKRLAQVEYFKEINNVAAKPLKKMNKAKAGC